MINALPRLTDIDGVYTLKVWDGERDHNFEISANSLANLSQDIGDAMARLVRRASKEPVR